MKLPLFTKEDVEGKCIIVRADLDVGEKIDKNERRLDILVELLEEISESAKSITIIGHRGRPEGKVDESLSLKNVSKEVERLLEKRIGKEKMKNLDMDVMDNLRFSEREEKNEDSYAKHLAEDYDVYINEAFSASHREHASIVGLPKHLKSFAGPHFIKEVQNLEKVLENPKKPVVFIISGIKDGKLVIVEKLKNISDKILIGGKLPDQIHDSSPFRKDPKVVVANLVADKEDITINSIDTFKKEIKNAGTLVINGPLGKFEDEVHMQGTKEIFSAVANSDAYKVAGGGETEVVLKDLGLTEKFDWISVGGGAMLEFLSKGTLPGIEALLH